MKPDEIKKAWKCCTAKGDCADCPLSGKEGCTDTLSAEALNYINKLESEVESIQQQVYAVYADLSKIIKNQRTEIDGLKTRNINNCRHWQKKYSSLRAEAIKEFARKLKCGVPQETGVIRCKDVDDLVDRLVGESNDT